MLKKEKELMLIGFGAQIGGNEPDIVFGPIHVELNQVFRQFDGVKYFRGIDELSIIFRVSGKIRDFQSEGAERCKINRKKRYITIDLVIPEDRWRDLPEADFRSYVANGVRDAFEIMVARARKEKGMIIDENKLYSDFETALSCFEKGGLVET